MALASLLLDLPAVALGAAATGLEVAATTTRKLAEALTTDASATTVELTPEIEPVSHR